MLGTGVNCNSVGRAKAGQIVSTSKTSSWTTIESNSKQHQVMLTEAAAAEAAKRSQRHRNATIEFKDASLATGRLAGPPCVAPAARRYAASLALCLIVLCLISAGAVGQTSTISGETARPQTPPTAAPIVDQATSGANNASSTLGGAMQTDAPPADDQLSPLQHQQQQQNKLKPVNFTLVDELFSATLDENELVKRWRHMDSQFQESVRSILKLIFPQIVSISQDAKVSGDCSGGILKWILSLRNLRSWAIKMLDATGKPTSGIFQGSLTMMGNYGQCLSVRAPDEDEIEITDQFEEYFRGQFCVIHLRPHLPKKEPFYQLNSTIESLIRKQYKYYEKTLYDELAEIAIAFQFIDIRMDLCVPSTCTRADIQRVAELLGKKLEFRAKVLRCDIEARDSSGSLGALLVNDEQAQYWLALPTVVIVLTLLASALVSIRRLCGSKQSSSGWLARLVYALSLQAALARLLWTPDTACQQQKAAPQATNQRRKYSSPMKPWPLYGLRNLIMVWFIIVQMTIQLKYQYLRESLVLRNMLLAYWPFQIIINTTMIFESLLLITAFTYGYCNLESSIGQLLGNIGRKYARIIPSMVTIIAITIVTPSLGIVSPVWQNFVEEQAATCRSTGYINLFFLQNFISYDKVLIAVSIPLVALLKNTYRHLEAGNERDPKDSFAQTSLFVHNLLHLLKSKAGLLAIGSTLFGAGLNFFIVYTNRLPPAWFNTFPDAEHKNYYFGAYLAKTWTHLSTFLVGLLAGHLCRSTLELMHRARSEMQHESTSAESTDSTSDNLTTEQIPNPSDQSSVTSSRLTSTATEESPASNRGLVISMAQMQSVEPKISIKQSSSLWLQTNLLQVAALACLFAVIFSTYTWSTQQLPSPLISALFDSLSRLLWSLALVGLMIQLCLPKSQTNNLTSFAQLLSCKSLIVLGRLSLLIYLWAPYVHTFILAVQEQALFPSLFLIFHVILGNIVITISVAFIASIFVEQPIRLAIDSGVTQANQRYFQTIQ